MSEEVEVKSPEQKGEQKAEEKQIQSDLPPAMQRKYQEAINQAKNRGERIKELEAKLAEAAPYVEKFKGHEDARQLEAQRAAETRARQEAEARARQEIEWKRERAILKALIGVVPPGVEGAGEFAVWKLSTDPSVVLDPETGSLSGLPEALEALKVHPLFSVLGKVPEPKKPAPGLPDTKAASGANVDQKFANVKSFADLAAMGVSAVQEYFEKYPDKYAALKSAQRQGLASPTRVIPPAAMRSN